MTITQNGTTSVEKEPTPELEMHSPAYYGIFYAHETYEEKIAFTVNSDWAVAVEYKGQGVDWLTVTPNSGAAGDAELVMTVSKNPSINLRNAKIQITYGGETTSLPVSQLGLNLAYIFGRQFAEELERRGYVPSARIITPQDVKGIKTLQMHGNWDASREVYLGELTSLNGLEYFESLESLTCWGHRLTSLDVSHNKALKELFCYSSQLTSLDVSKNPELRNLDCFNNPGDGAVFPVLAWFDNATIPTGMYTRFTTKSWSSGGNPIAIDYRKVD